MWRVANSLDIIGRATRLTTSCNYCYCNLSDCSRLEMRTPTTRSPRTAAEWPRRTTAKLKRRKREEDQVRPILEGT